MTAPATGAAMAVPGTGAVLRTRWLGTVPYAEALALQRGFHRRATGLLDRGCCLMTVCCCWSIPIPTHSAATPIMAMCSSNRTRWERSSWRSTVGVTCTYHGPGQLVAYPLVTLADHRGRSVLDGGVVANLGWVRLLEAVLIDTLEAFGVAANRRDGFPGVWVDGDRAKVAAVGVRVERGRTLHGVALNVDPDLSMFDHIVPCGITDGLVTSMRSEGSDATMLDVVDAFTEAFAARWLPLSHERVDVVVRRDSDGDADLSPLLAGYGYLGAAVGSSDRGRGYRSG